MVVHGGNPGAESLCRLDGLMKLIEWPRRHHDGGTVANSGYVKRMQAEAETLISDLERLALAPEVRDEGEV